MPSPAVRHVPGVPRLRADVCGPRAVFSAYSSKNHIFWSETPLIVAQRCHRQVDRPSRLPLSCHRRFFRAQRVGEALSSKSVNHAEGKNPCQSECDPSCRRRRSSRQAKRKKALVRVPEFQSSSTPMFNGSRIKGWPRAYWVGPVSAVQARVERHLPRNVQGHGIVWRNHGRDHPDGSLGPGGAA